MKKCELCGKVARMYCESDEASLCWDCDSRVHTANFLVAKHTRTLLCHACQGLTPWRGSGTKLGPIVSVCEACVSERDRDSRGPRNGSDDDDDDDSENQVVPLSSGSNSSGRRDASSNPNASSPYDVTEKAGEKKRS